MTRDEVVKGLECAIDPEHGRFKNCNSCACRKDVDHLQYVCDGDKCIADTIALLKAYEPRLVTEADFATADECGYITAWCEASNGLFAECITIRALQETDFRYWTSRPTAEQMEATPWPD